MFIIILGYICGIIHKFTRNYDVVTYLYVFNLLIVSCDLVLYFYYIKKNRTELLNRSDHQLK